MSISYRKRGKNNRWDYRVFDKDKKVVASNSGFRTKKEAEIEALEIELQLIKGAIIDKKISLYGLWKRWFELVIIPQNKAEATILKHQLRGRRIKEFFEDKPVVDIIPSQYQAFINSCASENSKDSVSRLNAEIRNVIKFAQRDKLQVEDFTIGVIITGKKVGRKSEEKFINSASDYHKLLEHFANELNYEISIAPYFLYLQLKTGLRFGEVVGLTWDCILWKKMEIKTYRRYDSNRYRWIPPKTETSIRTVPIDKNTLEVLKKMKLEQEQVSEKYNVKIPDNMLFYNRITGIPTSPGINKYLQKSLRELNIEPFNLTSTGLRHTYPSVLMGQGIDIWAIAKIMGHKDITQITETYGHLIKEKENQESQKIRTFLLGSNK